MLQPRETRTTLQFYLSSVAWTQTQRQTMQHLISDESCFSARRGGPSMLLQQLSPAIGPLSSRNTPLFLPSLINIQSLVLAMTR